MAFEGKPISIPLKGIVRAGADTVVEAGTLNEAINLEYKDGSFVPYAPGECSVPLNNTNSCIKIHKTNWQENVIAISNNKLMWISRSEFENGDSGDWNYVDEDNEATEFTFVGNVICTDRLNYYIWNNTDGEYNTYLEGTFGDIADNGYADLPGVEFSVTSKCGENEESGQSRGEILFVNSQNYELTDRRTDIQGNTYIYIDLKSKADYATVAELARKAQYSVQEYGRFYGYFLVTYAYRLLNGDYIMASAPQLMNMPNCKYKDSNAIYIPTNGCSRTETGLQFPYGINDQSTWNDGAPRFDNSLFKVIAGTTEGDYTIRSVSENVLTSNPLFAYYHNGFLSSSYFFVAGAVSNRLGIKILSDIPDKYKDIIDCLCVFVSPQINPYKSFEYGHSHIVGEKFSIATGDSYKSAGYYFDLKSQEDIEEEIRSIRTMYLIDEIKFEDIKQYSAFEYHNYKGKLADALYTQTSLPITAFNRRQNIKGHVDAYNMRVHLFGYEQKLFPGYRLNEFVMNPYGFGQYAEGEVSGTSSTIEHYIETTIVSSEGTSKVVRGKCSLTKDTSHLYIGPFISYPDVNATKMKIFYKSTGALGNYATVTIPLKRNTSLGISYYLSPNLEYIDLRDLTNVPSDITVGQSTIVPTKSNDRFVYNNGLKTSDAKYPIYFPVRNTLQIGDGSIIGLAPLAVALSQDAFGTNPMLALCSDGVFALKVDTTGETTYLSSTPYPSREVCLNRNSICKIDGAVIFVSDKGLVLLDGQSSSLFLPTLNGIPKNTPSSNVNNGRGLYIYNKLIANDNIVQLSDSISTIDFLSYAKNTNTFVSYVSEKNKILVYNKNYSYSYFIDIPTRTVTKLGYCINIGDGNYPVEKYYKLSANGATQYSFDYLCKDGVIPTMFQTRPIRIEPGIKNSCRVIIEGYISGITSSDNWADMIVLGSIDSENWHVIGIKEKCLKSSGNTGAVHEFGAIADRAGMKYIMVIFAGKLDKTAHIDNIALTYKNKYNEKLKQ